jgi:hypothetical protein
MKPRVMKLPISPRHILSKLISPIRTKSKLYSSTQRKHLERSMLLLTVPVLELLELSSHLKELLAIKLLRMVLNSTLLVASTWPSMLPK